MKKQFLVACLLLPLFMAAMTSCKKDPPTVDFTYQADGLTVTFTSVATDTDTYLWNFGDNTTSAEANPVHTYVGGGEYEVVVNVTGEGGTALKKEKITVSPNINDLKVMLTGGPTVANGKTWVLKTDAVTEGDGASAVEPSLMVLIAVPADFYAWMGQEKETGKKDEFTFKHDGTYTIKPMNDTVVSISLFAFANQLTVPNSNTPYGTCRATPYAQPAGATWTLNETDFTVDAITNPSETNIPPVHGNVTFTGKKWLSFSTGSYFGFLDFSTSSHIIIKSISPTELRVAMMVCMYAGAADPSGAGLPFMQLPTHMYHMTFVPK